jgi:hypothetical protein
MSFKLPWQLEAICYRVVKSRCSLISPLFSVFVSAIEVLAFAISCRSRDCTYCLGLIYHGTHIEEKSSTEEQIVVGVEVVIIYVHHYWHKSRAFGFWWRRFLLRSKGEIIVRCRHGNFVYSRGPQSQSQPLHETLPNSRQTLSRSQEVLPVSFEAHPRSCETLSNPNQPLLSFFLERFQALLCSQHQRMVLRKGLP